MNERMDDRSCPSASPALSPVLCPWPLDLGHPGLHFLYSRVCPRIQLTWHVPAPSRPQESPSPPAPRDIRHPPHMSHLPVPFLNSTCHLCNVILIREMIYPLTVVSAPLLIMYSLFLGVHNRFLINIHI